MSPAAALSILIYTPAAVGAVGSVPDPAHAMGPRVIPLVVIVELFWISTPITMICLDYI